MGKGRFLERQANAKDSVSRLLEAVALEKSEIVRDAVIQRFEFSYEAVWKAMNAPGRDPWCGRPLRSVLFRLRRKRTCGFK